MTIRLVPADLDRLAASLPLTGMDPDQRLEAIAGGLGFQSAAAMLEAAAPSGPKDPVILTGELQDWREADGMEATDVAEDEAPILPPVRVVVKRDTDASVDVFVGGADIDYTQAGASSFRVERQGDTTRFMLYDGNCDSPRIFGVKDGEPLAELPNDWTREDRAELEAEDEEPRP